jgi:hypothetical protein
MTLVNQRKVNKLIRKFVNHFNPNTRFYLHTDIETCENHIFGYDTIHDTIEIHIDELTYIYDADRISLQVLKHLGYIFDIDAVVFFILHEIGHSLDTLNIDSFEYATYYATSMQNEYTFETEYRYRNIKAEKFADNYAYQTYLHNYEFVKKFNDELLALL